MLWVVKCPETPKWFNDLLLCGIAFTYTQRYGGALYWKVTWWLIELARPRRQIGVGALASTLQPLLLCMLVDSAELVLHLTWSSVRRFVSFFGFFSLCAPSSSPQMHTLVPAPNTETWLSMISGGFSVILFCARFYLNTESILLPL